MAVQGREGSVAAVQSFVIFLLIFNSMQQTDAGANEYYHYLDDYDDDHGNVDADA